MIDTDQPKTAIVTGATGAIGGACRKVLRLERWNVAVRYAHLRESGAWSL